MIEPGYQIGITIFLIIGLLTSYGIYVGFGPESKDLVDPFDDHDD